LVGGEEKMTLERKLLRGGTVVSTMPNDPPRVADVLIEDCDIVEIGSDLSRDAEIIDVDGCLISPGFVDAHRHTWQTQMRAITHDCSLRGYAELAPFGGGLQYAPGDMYLGNLAGMLEAINAGVTTVLDFCHNLATPDHVDAAIRGTDESGIRSMFAFGLNAVPNAVTGFSTASERIGYLEELRDEHFSSPTGLVTLGAGLSDAVLAGAGAVIEEAQAVRRLGLPITLHGYCVNLPDPISEVDMLRDGGSLGPGIVWVHMGFATDHHLQQVIDSGGALCSTPETEMQLGMGGSVFDRCLHLGGEPSLGVDTVANNSGCMFSQMRLALQTARHRSWANMPVETPMPERVEPRSADVFRAATVGGAKAMGLETTIGTVEPGRRADLIAIRADDINMIPLTDAIGSIVLQAHPGNVDTVMIDGKVLKRHGKLVTDLADVKRKLLESHARISRGVAGTELTDDQVDRLSRI
jgi:5-methylthioadenosine/S-adenosylhomocysteine deaminase